MHEYYNKKNEYAYNLEKKHKFFKKARAIIFKGDKLLVLKFLHNNEMEYAFPGGGVDEGETAKDAAVRETLEEYGALVKPVKFLGKEYYNRDVEFNGEKKVSHRVQYYYICKFERMLDEGASGLEGEFEYDRLRNQKIELPMDEVKNIKPINFGILTERVYNALLKYIEEYKKSL